MPFGPYADFADCVDQNQDKEFPEAFCAWMEHELTGEWPGEKSMKGEKQMEEIQELLSGPIVTKNKDKRIVTAPVLVPGEFDADGEKVTEEKIEEVALKFLEDSAIIDIGHTLNQVAVPVENWLLKKDETFTLPDGKVLVAPKGTWMLSAKIKQNSVWNGVLNGTYKGFSVTGVRKADVLRAIKSQDDKEIEIVVKRKTLLKDLGEDWVPVTVAIVENPSVFKSKWIAIKEADKEKGPLEKLLNKLGIKTDEQNQGKEIEMEKAEIKALVDEAIKEAIGGLDETIKGFKEATKSVEGLAGRIEAIETSLKEKAPPAEGDETSPDDPPAEEEGSETPPAEDATPADEAAKSIADLTKEVEALKKKIAPKAKGMSGTDGEDDDSESAFKTKEEIRRDMYGRRIN